MTRVATPDNEDYLPMIARHCTACHVDAHHIEHWADGGETRLGNLLSLCRHHHALVHEGGFRIEITRNGQPVFKRPDGATIPHVPTEADIPETVKSAVQKMNKNVSAGTLLPDWLGENMDLGLAVDGLVQGRPNGFSYPPPL